jgi:hypothetical protein
MQVPGTGHHLGGAAATFFAYGRATRQLPFAPAPELRRELAHLWTGMPVSAILFDRAAERWGTA